MVQNHVIKRGYDDCLIEHSMMTYSCKKCVKRTGVGRFLISECFIEYKSDEFHEFDFAEHFHEG